MSYNFCTLFDKNFLVRGLALHQSLLSTCPDFTLWMMCMDELAYSTLTALNLKNVKLLRITEVEDEAMKAVKPSRTPVEYCWMFSSALPLYLLEQNPTLASMTYIDADLYFYESPEPIYKEMGEDSILLIPHNYSPKQLHHEKNSGTFNVGMMIFKNDAQALECLRWWKARCIEWCYNRYEDGKFGDQLYLNEWPKLFKGIHVLEHRGANVASWNIFNYSFVRENGRIWVQKRNSLEKWPLIFYHFHGLRLYLDGRTVKAYPVTILNTIIYMPYLRALQTGLDQARVIDPQWNYGFVQKISFLRIIKQHIQRLFHE